jgi:phosphate transport system permease protein
MSDERSTAPGASAGQLPEGETMLRNIAARRRRGAIWRGLLFGSLVIGILALVTLLYNIVNDSNGLVAVQYKKTPEDVSPGKPLDQLSKEELEAIFKANVSAGLYRRYNREQPFVERSQENMLNLVYERVIELEIVKSYKMAESLLDRPRIEAEVAESFPNAELQWEIWLDGDFLVSPMASTPAFAGVRTALLGSLYLIFYTIIIAVPIGVAAAIYLEEYAVSSNPALTRLNQVIETNINNLAGVPSIIYGILGLAIFVRALEYYMSGQFVGVTDSNGRTIISAALTMALLILPLIIINAREAIRAVPSSLRQASYGLGATKWQTVWHHVLPNALPGILTGTILGVSRAIGETAPLIVVGASTFIVTDPDGPFSKFTVLPIQIYNWTSQPNEQFRNIAAAAIIVLLVMLLTLNAAAVLLRNRFRRSY